MPGPLAHSLSFQGRVPPLDYALALLAFGIGLTLFAQTWLHLQVPEPAARDVAGALLATLLLGLSGAIWLSHLWRRLRDIGCGPAASLGVLGAVALLWLAVPQVGALSAAIPALLLALIPAWDRHHGLGPRLALLRRVALAGEGGSRPEQRAFTALCQGPLAVLPDDQPRALRDFIHGHRDSLPLDRLIRPLRPALQRDPGAAPQLMQELWRLAEASGRATPAQFHLLQQIAATLGLPSSGLPQRMTDLITLLARFACADGRPLGAAQIHRVSRICKAELRAAPHLQAQAMSLFHHACQGQDDPEPLARRVGDTALRQGPAACDLLIQRLRAFARDSGGLPEAEAAILEAMTARLGPAPRPDAAPPKAPEPVDSPRHRYARILEVDPTATPREIRAAYRAQVRAHHPDRLAARDKALRDQAHERMLLIREAYDHLCQSRHSA